LANGHKSGGLVSVLASGPSACPKNVKDLTWITVVFLFLVALGFELMLDRQTLYHLSHFTSYSIIHHIFLCFLNSLH
jgi:hypothetical protein